MRLLSKLIIMSAFCVTLAEAHQGGGDTARARNESSSWNRGGARYQSGSRTLYRSRRPVQYDRPVRQEDDEQTLYEEQHPDR